MQINILILCFMLNVDKSWMKMQDLYNLLDARVSFNILAPNETESGSSSTDIDKERLRL
jgi:hypothetical protein